MENVPGKSSSDTRSLNLYAAAEKYLSMGQPKEAEWKFKEAFDADPGHTRALYRLALLSFQGGKLDRAIEQLHKAAETDPGEAAFPFRLGFVLQHAGRIDEAIAQYDRAFDLHPGNVAALVKAGMLLLDRGDRDQASEYFQKAVLIEPFLRDAYKRPNMTPAAREEMRRLSSTLQDKYKRLVDETRDYIAGEYASHDRSRIEAAFRILDGSEKKSYEHPLQRPEFLYVPGVEPRAWFEREEFDWVPTVEAATEDILEELNALREEQATFDPYIQSHRAGVKQSTTPTGTDFSSLLDNPDWGSFHMDKAGRIPENCERCPKTVAVMDSIPQPQARSYMPEVFFSRLKPDTHIIPHYGQMNVRLTVHLGLIIPDDCGIRVGGETRKWEVGKILLFDDSFEHEAWNRDTTDRVVLIFEAWHPDLREVEIAALQHFFETRADFLDKCAPPTD